MHPHKVPMVPQHDFCSCGPMANELHLAIMDVPLLVDPVEQQKAYAEASMAYFGSHQDNKHRSSYRRSLQQWYSIPGEETKSASPVATKNASHPCQLRHPWLRPVQHLAPAQPFHNKRDLQSQCICIERSFLQNHVTHSASP